MKKLAWLLLFPALCGCARHYVITLNNHSKISAQNKPKLQNGVYVFKDGLGRESFIPAGRVSQIAPASLSSDESSAFKPSSSK